MTIPVARITFCVIILVSLFIPLGVASAADPPTHTLTISSNSTVSYEVTASGSVTFQNEEKAEYIHDSRLAAGSVGKGNDTTDVIQYNGYITSFKSQDGVQVQLNGRSIAPNVLNGTHLTIVHPTNASGSTLEYYYPLTNGSAAEHGELAEKSDVANEMQIQGSIDSGADSFYYQGEIPDRAFSGMATVRIDGEVVQSLDNPPSTSSTATREPQQPTTANETTTPHLTLSTATSDVTATQQPVTGTQQQPSETGSSPTTSSGSQTATSASEQSSSLLRSVMIGLGVGLFAIIVLILVSISIDTYLISK